MDIWTLKPSCSPTGDLISGEFPLGMGNWSSEPREFSTTRWSAGFGSSMTDGWSTDAGLSITDKSFSDSGDSAIGGGTAAGNMLDFFTSVSEWSLRSC